MQISGLFFGVLFGGVLAAVIFQLQRHAQRNSAMYTTAFRKHVVQGPKSRSAIVIGATGATGRQVLQQLLDSDEWGKITTFGRRPPLSGPHEKLSHHTVENFDDLEATVEHWAGHDIVFHCIGTTRGQAGGAEPFYKIEVEYTRKVATIASDSGIKAFSVVTARGADPTVSRVDWFHPMLYTHSLGMKEEVIKEQKGLLRISIFRPGMLNRLTGDRTWEVVVNTLGLGIRVDLLAQAMIYDAETEPVPKNGEREMVHVYEGNTLITQLANSKM